MTPTSPSERTKPGAPVHAASEPRPIACHEPATGRWLGQVDPTPPEGMAAVVDRARRAQQQWRGVPMAERARVLGYVLDHLLEHADELCETIVRDSGKTKENAMLGEIWPVAEKLRWTIAQGEKHLRPERVSAGLLAHKRATIHYEPLGVIGVIAPWNYPLQNILGPAVPALMAGNAVICKVSEWTAWSAARFQAIFDDALARAGYPRDLVQVINGWADTGQALVNAGVDKIVFTGSLDNGKSVLAASASTLTPTILELGGKDAMIICDDAHMETAVHSALAGVFIHAGQNCLAAERLLVFDRVYAEFETEITKAVRALTQAPPLDGAPVDVAAIVSPLQLDRIEALVEDAVAKGARVLAGGHRALSDVGQYFEPTILADVTPQMRIVTEELFGPVMLLQRVSGEREAIEVANGTEFGLGATVITQSQARARRMAGALVVGQVSINDFAMTYMANDLPFGGVGGSGFGRLNGREGLRAFTNIKSVLEDRFRLPMPAKLYPIGRHDYEMARGVIRTIYGRGPSAKLDGLRQTLRVVRKRIFSA